MPLILLPGRINWTGRQGRAFRQRNSLCKGDNSQHALGTSWRGVSRLESGEPKRNKQMPRAWGSGNSPVTELFASMNKDLVQESSLPCLRKSPRSWILGILSKHKIGLGCAQVAEYWPRYIENPRPHSQQGRNQGGTGRRARSSRPSLAKQ